jgi:hypothetical protein
MDDNNDNHDSLMDDIISSGTNTIPFTDEECIQEDMFLNIPPTGEDVAAVKDLAENDEDHAENNDDIVYDTMQCSKEVCVCVMH